MPTYRVQYLPDAALPPESVDAESVDLDTSGVWLVFRRTVYVIGKPREVVVRRLAAREVAEVAEV